jgi:hypothetical protein
MFRLDSEEKLLAAFRPKDRGLVELVPEVKLPAIVRHYLAWSHPAGGRVFLVFATPGGAPTGIVFDTSGGGTQVPQMCDWCYSCGTGGQVGLLTARLDAHRRVGLNVCSDLSCMQKIEDEANRSGRAFAPLLDKVVERMGRFAHEALKIDLSYAGR